MKILFWLTMALLISPQAFAEFRVLRHQNVVINAVGATDRVQLDALEADSCTIQANSANVGDIYVGDHTVTNASGANPGVRILADGVFNSIGVQDRRWIHLAADDAGDGVVVLCN